MFLNMYIILSVVELVVRSGTSRIYFNYETINQTRFNNKLLGPAVKLSPVT
jgi:hypothetical protein